MTTGGERTTSRSIDIAMCIDENMLGPALVALHSISVHAQEGRDIRVHVVATGLSDFAARLRDALDRPSFRIDIIPVENPYARFPENDYISPATYLRFLLPDLLAIDKVLYLDADVVTTRDLGALFDVDLGSSSIGAVPDFAMSLGSRYQKGFKLFYDGKDYSFASYVSHVVGLRRHSSDLYFNAGVMLIDLQKWRQGSFVEDAVSFLNRHRGLSFLDQDGLNSICAGAYRALDCRWNCVVGATGTMPNRWRDRLSAKSRCWKEVCAMWLRDPWIIHFAGPSKPWSLAGPHPPMSDVWRSYAERSPAAGMFAELAAQSAAGS